jgi:colanic acid/amylovoran biosynthesis glycosyltransferase
MNPPVLPRDKRVAVVTAHFPYGPGESFLADEIAELAKSCRLTVFTAVHGIFLSRVLGEAILEFVRAPLSVARIFLTVVRAPRSLGAKVKNAAIFPKALASARAARREGIEHVHAYWLSVPATVAFVISELNGTPWSATGHRYDLVDFNLTAIGKPNAGFVGRARFVRTISHRGEQAVRVALGNTDANRITTVHLGVRLGERAGIQPRKSLRLLCAAALVPVKDHATLFRALSLADAAGVRLECTLAGDGPERRRLIRLASQLGIEHLVRFGGIVPHSELLVRLSKGDYDVAILTSTDRGLRLCEGIPVSLIEAMSAGIACIATASGSVGELVKSGVNGLLCNPGDANGLAEMIDEVASDNALRRRLGEAARVTVEREFDATKTARRLAELLGGSTPLEGQVPA